MLTLVGCLAQSSVAAHCCYQILKSVLPFKNSFHHLATENVNFTTCLSDEDWEELATIQDFLAIFHTGLSVIIYLLILMINLFESLSTP
jgi:hypothetical protein